MCIPAHAAPAPDAPTLAFDLSCFFGAVKIVELLEMSTEKEMEDAIEKRANSTFAAYRHHVKHKILAPQWLDVHKGSLQNRENSLAALTIMVQVSS